MMARKKKNSATPDPAPAPTPQVALQPALSGRVWTAAQRRGIQTVGTSLLLSAAAGSGKTAVLAERCAYLVCDAPEPHRCDVTELLVVTFTEAAAAEMRARIQRSLTERLARAEADGPAPRLAHQVALVEHAQISTLHGFCARLVRQHFHLLGLDPNFTILDGDEATLMRSEVARRLFDARYETDADGRFQSFIDAYADGNDARLLDRVVSTHEMLCSVIDPAGWRRAAIDGIREAAESPLRESALGRELIRLVNQRLAALRDRIANALRTLSRMEGFGKYVEQLGELDRRVGDWQATLESSGIDRLAEEANIDLPRTPSVPSGTPGKDLAKSLIDAVKEEMKPKSALFDALRFTEAEWRAGLRANLPYAETFLGLVEEFGRDYVTEKRAQRAVDFSDLERLALQVLRDTNDGSKLTPSTAARGCHELFRHVLVDEYQDINEVQDAILTLVSRECVADCAASESDDTAHDGDAGSLFQLATGNRQSTPSPNLFCVGDVKQSIYRFRLAEPGLFLRRDQRFRDPAGSAFGAAIDLQNNFRSRGPLLEVINGVFERLMTRDAAEIHYDQTHFLVPGLTFPDGDGATCFKGAPVELHLLPEKLTATSDDGGAASAEMSDLENDLDRAGREALLIARRVHQLTGADGTSPPAHVMERGDDGELHPRRLRHGDIVILLRSLKYKADQYADVLRQAGIPVHSESGTGYFESTEVRDVLALLGVLDNQRQDVPLAAVLRSPLACLPQPEDALARVRLAYPPGPDAPPFHQAVVRYAREHDDELSAHLRDFLGKLTRWRDLAHRRPLAELIWAVYDETGYLAFCAGLPDGQQRVANLVYLHERARQFGTFQRQGLARFLAFLHQLREASDLGQPSVATEAEDVVRIMSVHASKGLEFPVVICPDLGKAINLADCRGPILLDRTAGLGLSVVDEARRVRYPSLASTLVEERLRRQALAEELRVLYVAMTRAKEHLILVGTGKESDREKWSARWSGHAGPLPADAVLGGRCILDWIGPVWAAMSSPVDGRQAIELTWHPPEEITQWPDPQMSRPKMSEWQVARARLEPLSPEPAVDETARQVIERVTQPYPFRPYTSLPAVASVTSLAKEGRTAPSGRSGTGKGGIVQFNRTLRVPRAVATDKTPTAAEIGVATHALLQRLDFAGPCDLAGIKAQAERLVAQRLISPRDAEHVDYDAILWLVGSPLGEKLRANASRLWREMPVYFAQTHPDAPDAKPPEPADRLMIRSRVDVLIDTPAGLEVVDYKTDRVTAEALDARAAFYEPQMTLYRDAVIAACRRPVIAVHLVFLSARSVRSSPGRR